MKKSVALMLLMTMAMSFAFLFVGCSNNQNSENYDYDNIMQSVYWESQYGIYYDKNTKVMYISGSGSAFTVMVTPGGGPQLYSEEASYNNVMQSVYWESQYGVYYDKNTKVMYLCRNVSSGKLFTVMVNTDGSPQLYKEIRADIGAI